MGLVSGVVFYGYVLLSSSGVNAVWRFLSCSLIFLMVSDLTGPLLLFQAWRMNVATSARCWSLICGASLSPGIAAAGLYFLPLTVMGPMSPWRRMAVSFSSDSLTHSEFTSGGPRCSSPFPSGPWQAMQLAM